VVALFVTDKSGLVFLLKTATFNVVLVEDALRDPMLRT